MDIDVFPNVIDYWGPCGMVFLRNPQIRWTPISGTHNCAIAIEQPFSDIDVGIYDRVIETLELEVVGIARLPNLTMQYRLNGDWGHVQVASILRQVAYETRLTRNNDPKNEFLGWGIDLSSNLIVGEKDKIILAGVYGEGIASYMNDGGVDLAPSRPTIPADVQTVPLLGIVGYYDHYWSDRWSSAFGYSLTQVDNLGGQGPDAFKRGEYASVNLLHYPTENVLCGVEYLWGKREDKDGSSGEDNRLQVSFKYSF
jgi:hypothetical protein